MTDEIPAVVRTTIAALRTAATWLPDEQRDLLYEAATVAENGGWEDACCPICQETWCDGGCPLEDFRNELLRKAEQDAGWPLPPGVVVYDRREPTGGVSELERYRATAAGLHANLVRMIDADMSAPSPLKSALVGLADVALKPATPFRRATSPGCYDASFGRVHVRPGCRC